MHGALSRPIWRSQLRVETLIDRVLALEGSSASASGPNKKTAEAEKSGRLQPERHQDSGASDRACGVQALGGTIGLSEAIRAQGSSAPFGRIKVPVAPFRRRSGDNAWERDTQTMITAPPHAGVQVRVARVAHDEIEQQDFGSKGGALETHLRHGDLASPADVVEERRQLDP